jgi:hypothetical protein
MEAINNIAAEFGGIGLGDKRLDRRFAETAERLGENTPRAVF